MKILRNEIIFFDWTNNKIRQQKNTKPNKNKKETTKQKEKRETKNKEEQQMKKLEKILKIIYKTF